MAVLVKQHKRHIIRWNWICPSIVNYYRFLHYLWIREECVTMQINADGIDREATEKEIAEIKAINANSYDINKEIEARKKARQAVADKLGLTADELLALLS